MEPANSRHEPSRNDPRNRGKRTIAETFDPNKELIRPITARYVKRASS